MVKKAKSNIALKSLKQINRGYRRLNWKGKIFGWIILLVIISVAIPAILNDPQQSLYRNNRANFYFVNKRERPVIGQPFDIDLHVKTNKQSINAVGVTLKYNPRILEILKMSTEKSFCSYYPENSFDNIKGEVHLYCGTPNPGFVGDSPILSLNMRPKNAGNAIISLDKQAQILANDGKGTNLVKFLPELKITIDPL